MTVRTCTTAHCEAPTLPFAMADRVETRYDDKRGKNYYYNPATHKTGWTLEDGF